jgi:hypothetical protein
MSGKLLKSKGEELTEELKIDVEDAELSNLLDDEDIDKLLSNYEILRSSKLGLQTDEFT